MTRTRAQLFPPTPLPGGPFQRIPAAWRASPGRGRVRGAGITVGGKLGNPIASDNVEQGDLRVQRATVALGFLSVAAGQLPFLGLISLSSGSESFFWVVSALGWVTFGGFSWVWLSALSRSRGRREDMRWALSLIAVACLFLGVAYAGLINELIEVHHRFHGGIKRQAFAYGLPLLGFCLASVGFGSAARSCPTTSPVDAPDIEATNTR